jgi:hypothetical protein
LVTEQQNDGGIPGIGDALSRLVGVLKNEIDAQDAKDQMMRKRLWDREKNRKPEK